MSLFSNIGNALKNFGQSVSSGCKNLFSGISEKAAPICQGIGEVIKSSFSADAIKGSVEGLASGGWVGAIIGGVQGTAQNVAKKVMAAQQEQMTAEQQAAYEQQLWEEEQARRVAAGGTIQPRSTEVTGVTVSANIGSGGVSGLSAEPVKNEKQASKWERYNIFTRIMEGWNRK